MHKDVLDADPQDEAGKQKLVEEIRGRAKGAIQQKVYPAADALYSKAIKVIPDATLHGNRSMVKLALGEFGAALDDANEAIKLDPAYSKAFYRKGMALTKLKRHDEAAEAYDSGLALEPDSKTFKDLAAKARESAAKALDEPPPLKEAKPAIKMPITKPRGFDPKVTATAKEGSKDTEMRGYKVTADGKKTTFFNHDLDDEAKALIGDIRPKKLDEATALESSEAGGQTGGASVWNTAGTWEERTLTPWGRDRLSELLVGVEFVLPNDMGVVKTTKLKDLEGDCSITMARGKKKHLFDWAFSLDWAVDLKGVGKCKGSIKYPDVTPDCDQDYEAQIEVDQSTPPSARALIDAYVRSNGSGLQPAITKQIQAFVGEFNAIE